MAFLIIGARRVDDRWVLDGVSFPGEPRVWLSDIIGRGLDPRPTFDVHAWEVEEGRHVAVVQVEQVATPPCMTSSGQVYLRLPGKTELVAEAAILASLFDQGQKAREQAEAIARRAVERDFDPIRNPYLLIHVGVAPTGKAEDVAGVLFSRESEEKVRESFERLPREPLFPYPSHGNFQIRQTRTAVIADPYGDDRQRWRIRCRWDGSVLISLAIYPEADAARLLAGAVFADAVRPAVDEALRLAKELGGFGPAHLILKFETGGFQIREPAPYGELGFRPQSLRRGRTI